jgi:hypothetical protein
MFGFTPVFSLAGILLFVASGSDCNPWHRIDSTKEVVGSGEMEPWDQDLAANIFNNYDDVEKPVRYFNKWKVRKKKSLGV